MVRKARASMARVVHWYQESHRRAWCSSSPVSPFAGLEILLRGPADPGDLDQEGQRDVAGAVAAVERQLPGAAVTADQQPAVTGPSGVDGQPGPVVVAVPLGAGAGGVALPRLAGQPGGDRAGLAKARRGGDLVAGGHRQHVTGPAAFQVSAQAR